MSSKSADSMRIMNACELIDGDEIGQSPSSMDVGDGHTAVIRVRQYLARRAPGRIVRVTRDHTELVPRLFGTQALQRVTLFSPCTER